MAIVRIDRIGISDKGCLFSCKAAQQFEDRFAGLLSGDIPERKINGRERVCFEQLLGKAIVRIKIQTAVSCSHHVRRIQAYQVRHKLFFDDSG